MQEPQITYRDMPHSPALDARIRDLAAKLEEFHPKITRCRVVINEVDKHKQNGNLFEARVDVRVPQQDILATHQRHEDPYAAVTAAFDVLFRQLEENIEKVRGKVKKHADERGDDSTP